MAEPRGAARRATLRSGGFGSWSSRGDQAEREAEALASAALDGRQVARPGIASGSPGQSATGTALAAETRLFFESGFGRDFSHVRVQSDAEASRRAAALGSRAYVVGQDIVWGGSAPPDHPESRPLMAHELAHVAGGHTAAHPRIAFRAEAELPTGSQQRDIFAKFNPQQSAGDVPEVTDPAGFKAQLKTKAEGPRDTRFADAVATQTAPVSLSTADLTDVTKIAADRVDASYHSYLAAGINLTAIRNKIKYIPKDPGNAPAPDEANLPASTLDGLDISSVDITVMRDTDCQAVITGFNVLAGGRDKGLYQQALTGIRDAAPAKWRKIALSMRGWDMPALPLLQRHIQSAVGEADAATRRRGRWMNVGTSIHEILHAVTHTNFSQVTFATESRRLGAEGFTEFFTREAYLALVADALSDPALLLSIEGAPGPPMVPPPRQSYNDFFGQVQEILDILGGNEENLREAYFRGKVEYIGLGPWNERQRGARRQSLGAAILFRTTGGSLTGTPSLRADWGYLVLGKTGDYQLDLRLGTGLTFFSEGDRLGLGPQVSGTIRGAHLFLTGGAMIQGSVSLAQGVGDPRFDAVLRLEGGVQVGRFEVGPNLTVLVPINEPDTAKRAAQVYVGLGMSFTLGK